VQILFPVSGGGREGGARGAVAPSTFREDLVNKHVPTYKQREKKSLYPTEF